MLRYLLIGLIIILATSAVAQEVEIVRDTVPALGDSLVVSKRGKIINIKSYAKRYQPRKAILYAAILPGAGQLYNKKYWKVPLVFGGFYALTTLAINYNKRYIRYKDELYGLLDNPSITPPSGYTETQLRSLIDTYRRQRDYFIILDGFMYILQLVDAHVDSHLKEFDLNPQLKVSLRPHVEQNPMIGHASGFALTFKF